ncbi:arrestin domain-containing protein 1-like isoform X2 [Sitodiplosis mosellana]|uniref:arrestin domain-containing protein 1-like isoform X2 n=1 Tax=Sitodiplosis mosellana TaxID=263140 RepID=UPI0024449A17|nr:arrestin domain-containing protein 1-like isoform X2 [Sitodiplosis mosellana]
MTHKIRDYYHMKLYFSYTSSFLFFSFVRLASVFCLWFVVFWANSNSTKNISHTRTLKINQRRNMPHTTTCKITFDDNPDCVYYGGQVVRGRVQLVLGKEKTIRGELTIEPGTYTYAFQVFLPLGVPTSLEAQHGHVRYGLQVVLDRPRWPDQKFEETFTVIKPLNLNHDLTLRHPIVEEETKRFNPFCLLSCCASDPLFMIATVPVSGYTPGQMINVDLELTNASNENVKAFILQIVREVKFFIYENSPKHKIERDAIAEVQTRGCFPQQKQAYTVNILVPPTPPTDVTTSKIVHVKYHLRIEGLTGCCHINPTITIPITIGSYPILDQPPEYVAIMNAITHSTNQNPNSNANANGNVAHGNLGTGTTSANNEQVVCPQQPSAPASEDIKTTDAEPAIPYPQNDPPSYEQAVKVLFERKFAPNYPVYRRQTSYSSQTNTPVLRRHCNS